MFGRKHRHNTPVVDTDDLIKYIYKKYAKEQGKKLPKNAINYFVMYYDQYLSELGIMSGTLDKECYGIKED